MKDYTKKIAELSADVHTIWKLQCQNLYNSKNLGALAVRESIQNSIDAIRTAEKKHQIAKGEGIIAIKFKDDTLTIKDNGCGMTLQQIHDKFLTLGGTTKGDEDNVGGFGLAKSVILGCGTGFKVETQDNVFTDKDLGVNPIQKQDYRQGTKLTLYGVQTGDGKTISYAPEDFHKAILDYVATSKIDGITVIVQGEVVEPVFVSTRKSRRLPAVFNIGSDIIPRDTQVRVNVFKNTNSVCYLYIRLRGLTQFKQYLGWNAQSHVVLDIDTKLDPRSTDYPFSTNREGLKAQYQGLTEAIRNKVSQSPIAIADNDSYKESFYDNKSTGVEQARVIASTFTSPTFMATASKVNEVMKGIIPQGGYKTPSIADITKQINTMVEDTVKAHPELTKQQVIKRLTGDSIKRLNNPLDHSWIIWEDKDTKVGQFHKRNSVNIIMMWDSVLRLMATNYKELQGSVFYPGIVVKRDTMGMCLEKMVNQRTRYYVMLNPYKIPEGDDTSMALYLMNLAAHELAHLACGTYEAHGETFSYTREAIINANLNQIGNVVKLLKAASYRKIQSRAWKTQNDNGNSISYSGVDTHIIMDMAMDKGIDVEAYRKKYHNEQILRMRLIMAIKKADNTANSVVN